MKIAMHFLWMSVERQLYALAGIASAITVLACIAATALDGFEFLLIPLITWASFATAMVLVGFAGLAGYFVLEFIWAFVPGSVDKETVHTNLRCVAFFAGAAALLWIGGRVTYVGLRDNRLVTTQILYERCMEPQARIVQKTYRECSDGFASPSIGRRGACSHHGGVVERDIERLERYQPHSAKYCLRDASKRSWLD